MATVPERAALLMEHLVTHDGDDGHGYSQYSRNGDGGIEVVRVGGESVEIATGDRDCSSAVISCYTALGVDCGGATYTGNMRSGMVGSGNFKAIKRPTSYSAQPGDIYLNESHHAAMCVSPYGSARGDLLAQFSISEKGTIDGREGDQTGRESNIRAFYDYPWDYTIVYTGKGGSSGPSSGASATGARWQTAYGDPNWFGPKMARELQRQLGTTVDGVISGQSGGNREYFWAVTGGVEYGSGGSDAILALQRMLKAAGFDPSGLDRHYGRGCIKAHQRWLKKKGYYTGKIDGHHGHETNKAMCRALAAGAYK